MTKGSAMTAETAKVRAYYGTACKTCGATARYICNNACVACARRKGSGQRQRERKLMEKYGLTQARYDELLMQQHGVCAICKAKDELLDNLCVDHDHETGVTRGLLCTHCNQALGKLRHDPSILQAAIDYIEQHHGEAWYPKA